ncbi:hypothetical protein BGZ63DRAFT_95634 [Mariannaea sp. PMI_226]|nr:hypothetical protein BGZ63DRAFT_95634 [Mariannaea sp. PMI_226]
MMSVRLSPRACLNLLEQTNCNTILYGNTASILSTLQDVSAERPRIKLQPLLNHHDFHKPNSGFYQPFYRPITDRERESAEVTLIAHSSGSTGLPKPLYLSHRSILNNLYAGAELKSFNGLPWSHMHGLLTSLQAMWLRKTAHLFNAHLPLTADNIISALKMIRPEICHCVPYLLSIIAEKPEGVQLLRECKYVTCSGAKSDDKLGDWLVEQGVNLVVIFGLTEVGHVGKSILENGGDNSWAYIRPYDHLRAHISFQEVGDGLYESVYLKSHPALMVSNSNEPPGSYHSGDLFMPHRTIPDAWKFVARRDDRITLSNGEKFLPFSMESTIRGSPLIRDALIVGNNKPMPGLLVFRTEKANGMIEEEFIDAIWTVVQDANGLADAFARITRETIVSFPAGVDYPKTDKHNIIRAACFSTFKSQIEDMYRRLDDGSIVGAQADQNLELDATKLERFIMEIVKTHGGIVLQDVEHDFFTAGVDSLRAIQIRNLLLKHLNLRGHKLPTNIIYDAGNTAKLAKLLSNSSSFADIEMKNGLTDKKIELMESLIETFSEFTKWVPGVEQMPAQDTVILTGATGAIGAHILQQLLKSPSTHQVVCLVRGPSGHDRIQSSLQTRGIDVEKIKPYFTKLVIVQVDDIGAPNLGIPVSTYNNLKATTTLIIHAAWPVNFGPSLISFEPHIAGLHNLLKLSLSVPFKNPARFLFASSISTALNTPTNGVTATATVPEGPVGDLTYSQDTGYARSKLVGERVCEAAAQAGGVVCVLRIGQVIGDTSQGIWNDHEAIPLMVRSALELKALPLLRGDKDRCEWLPVDIVAAACLDIAEGLRTSSSELKSKAVDRENVKAYYYNVIAPQRVSWEEDVLPALRENGLEFKTVSIEEWLGRVKAAGTGMGSEVKVHLPAQTLLSYYMQEYGRVGKEDFGLRFEINKTYDVCKMLRLAPNVVTTGLVGKILWAWLTKWQH